MKATIDRCIRGGNPFAAWRRPGTAEARLIFQKGREAFPFSPGENLPLESGYIAMPFFPGHEAPNFMIAADRLITEDDPQAIPEEELAPSVRPPQPEPAVGRKSYLDRLRKLIDRIRDEALEKVVLSRVCDVEKGGESAGELFDRLCSTYPDAYVHLFRIPGYGLWIGASPETLLELSAEEGRVQALAGTRPRGGDRPWTKKEEREQRSVAEYIEQVFQKASIPFLGKNGPRTLPAGPVEHLSTDFSFSTARAIERIPSLLAELHPTPAVCGVPKHRALELIEETEEHSRSFYAGAIGPWELDGARALYVNLRCFRVLEDRYQLYVGGGINDASDPRDEWEETEWKAEAMRRVLE